MIPVEHAKSEDCDFSCIKARQDDPFLRIRLLVPKAGSRRSDGPISRFHFCGENVGRSFVVCSHDPFCRTNKESSIWRQNHHAKFVVAFRLSRRVSDENKACNICLHGPFFGTYENWILKNGSCEPAFKLALQKVLVTRKYKSSKEIGTILCKSVC